MVQNFLLKVQLNGWYWMMNDGKGGREEPIKPRSVSELYRRIAVKKMNAEDWKWKKPQE